MHPVEAGKYLKIDLTRRKLLKLAGMGAATVAWPSGASGKHLAGNIASASSPAIRIPDGMAESCDLSLSDWGPYSKKYFGVSHIADGKRGISFDFSIFPWLNSKDSKLPSVLTPANTHPWEAASNLDYYTLRMEMIWKDQLYCDLSFVKAGENSRQIRMEIVNQSTKAQMLSLHTLSQLSYPPLNWGSYEPLQQAEVLLPDDALWVHALDYADLKFATPRPTDNLVPEGYLRGEERGQDSVSGSVLGQQFGRQAGDIVEYHLQLQQALKKASLVLRYIGNKGEVVGYRVTGAVTAEFTLHGTGRYETVVVPVGPLAAGSTTLAFVSKGGSPLKLNGFAIVAAEYEDKIQFKAMPWQRDPIVDTETVPGGVILGYSDIENCYGILLAKPLAQTRKLTWMQLDDVFGPSDSLMRDRRVAKPSEHRGGDPDCVFVNAAVEGLTIPPLTKVILYGVLATGSKQEVERSLKTFQLDAATNDPHFQAVRKTASIPTVTSAGKEYLFSQKLMSAVTLTSLVYPIYTQRQYIRHNTQGRCWDSIYTWDSGFMGLGLLELDPQRAVDLLNSYTLKPGAQSAFLSHGTPLPTHIYLFHELWNRTQSEELLTYFYPRLLQYYQFLAGRLGSSTTRKHKERLVCTWDYWYSTGGWDDYPPQLFIHDKKLVSVTAPAVSSSYLIRCAKILRMAALALGRKSDLAQYDQDMAELSSALQNYSWDKKSGYYGYVLHDDAGNPTGILRHSSGANFNMGLDGVSPLVAGICNAEQEKALLERIFSPEQMWTEAGITSVSKSAPYYSPDGYWNGNVWLAHQWFLWKTMLDLGRGDLAVRIAETGLKTWKRSTDRTYQCYEHFRDKDGMGAGWPQFPTLSSPVLPWFTSMYSPGRLTAGFDVWIESCQFDAAFHSLDARLTSAGSAGRPFSLLATMAPGGEYKVFWNGNPVTAKKLQDGLLQIELTRQGSGRLSIQRV